MKRLTLFTLLFILLLPKVFAQVYFGGKFKIKSYLQNGFKYTLYDFSREGAQMKAKYFAQNAYSQYTNWKTGKQILLVTAGAFSDSWLPSGKPVGLCVDNGTIVNQMPDNVMDAMVIIYNGSTQIGGIAVVDLDKKPVKVEQPFGSGQYAFYSPRSSPTDKIAFLNWGKSEGVTLFQSQLVYSADKLSSENFSNMEFGEKRERRFLALCKKSGTVHHVIVDAPDPLKLNVSAAYAKTVLEADGFTVLYIINLDTGDKNLLHAYNGSSLADLHPYQGVDNHSAHISNATNLVVYYKD